LYRKGLAVRALLIGLLDEDMNPSINSFLEPGFTGELRRAEEEKYNKGALF